VDNFEQSETPHQNLWTDGDSNPRPPHCPDDFGGVCWKKSEPILNEIPTDCRPAGGRTETERSGGQKGRGLGGKNFCPPSLSAAAEFRANEVGAPPFFLFIFIQ